jgi:hypothetical protein
MLELEELRLSGIGRFVDEQVINFKTLGKLTQLDAINHNTGGSSGAGKSTALHALDFLLGFNKSPTTVLKSRLTDAGIQVKGKFQYNGKPARIERGKKLFIEIDGVVTTGSSSITEAKLDEMLGMPRELFRKTMHKRQKEQGFFLSMGPADINKFLMDCLGHSGFTPKIAILDKKIKDLETNRTSTFNALDSSKSALKATEDAIVSLGAAPEQEVDSAAVERLKAKWDQTVEFYRSIMSSQQMDKDVLELSRPVLKSTPFNRETIDYCENTIRSAKEAITKLQQKERDRQALVIKNLFDARVQKNKLLIQIDKGKTSNVEAIRIAKEIKKIRDSLCPTCDQNWATETAKTKEATLLAQIGILREDIRLAAHAVQNMESVDSGILNFEMDLTPQEDLQISMFRNSLHDPEKLLIAERQSEKDHLATELAKNRLALSEFTSKQREMSAAQTIEQNQWSGQENIDRRAFDAATNKLRSYSEAITRYKSSQTTLFKQSQTYKENIVGLTAALAKIETDLFKTEELKRGIKSYLSCSFDDALATISDQATTFIRKIPNMATATIVLEGIRETNDGKLKEEVNAVLHMDGEENVDIRSLSGGEGTSADLAVDLAAVDLIESKCNKGINLFIIDEGMGGLDSVNCEQVLELLKNSGSSKKIIMVDHSPELKAMVESSITVVRTGATSTITQS